MLGHLASMLGDPTIVGLVLDSFESVQNCWMEVLNLLLFSNAFSFHKFIYS